MAPLRWRRWPASRELRRERRERDRSSTQLPASASAALFLRLQRIGDVLPISCLNLTSDGLTKMPEAAPQGAASGWPGTQDLAPVSSLLAVRPATGIRLGCG